MYAKDETGQVRSAIGGGGEFARGAGGNQEIPEAARWFEALASYAPAPAFIRDGQGRYLWVNAAYAHLYGMEPQSVVGRTVEEIDAPDDAAMFRALDREVLSSRRPVRHTLVFRHPDGTPRQVTGHRFVLDLGRGLRVGGIYTDVTDQARALEDKAAAAEELHALWERSGLAIVTLDLRGRIQRVSGGVAELLGGDRASLEGSRALGHLRGDPRAVRNAWADLVAGKACRRTCSVVCGTASGGSKVLRADLAVVRRRGTPDRVSAVLTPRSLEFGAPVQVSPVQLRVLSLVAAGRSNGAIATDLGLSRQALDYHLRRLRVALDADSRPALVARAYTLGIFDSRVWPPRAAVPPYQG
ncbi:PAS domain-containing protein [Streptomyces sp. CJ_13]|uniref:helix-turn-helix transcriptional regulator n=1 Tax=Streptomyces sp. CJ_13 TaxID=2724943 RepID=UPI001BDCC4E2|nr:PAS domain-containing protein [Streptomyces sp. CJ_13]MBT1189694.1 PAS domain-containing protein [Streptomyces sp. CJ_13]